MLENISLWIDDTSASLASAGTGAIWVMEQSDGWMGRSQRILTFNTDGESNIFSSTGSARLSFFGASLSPSKHSGFDRSAGTRISVFGLTAHLDESRSFLASIDDTPATSHDLPPSPQHPFHEWYTSPDLISGWHSLELSALPVGISFDYAVSRASSETLSHYSTPGAPPEVLVIDDSDLDDIKYDGSW
jgi:hypothetical protein